MSEQDKPVVVVEHPGVIRAGHTGLSEAEQDLVRWMDERAVDEPEADERPPRESD